MAPGNGGDELSGGNGADDVGRAFVVVVDIFVQLFQIGPRALLAQAENLTGGGDVSAAGGGGIGPDKYVLIRGVQQVVPGLRHIETLGGQLLVETVLVDDDAQNAHVPALPEMVGIVEPLVQAVVVGGVILQEGSGLGERAVQVHGAPHQEIGLGVVHLRLHPGHGVAAAQGDVFDFNPGVSFELVGNGNGVVLIQSRVNHQLSPGGGRGISAGGGRAAAAVLGCGIAAAGGQ